MGKPVLIVAAADDAESLSAVREGFCVQYGQQLDFEIIEDPKIIGGFIAIIEGTVYDASFSSRLNELGRQISSSHTVETESTFSTVGSILKSRVETANTTSSVYSYGEVERFADNIAHVRGLGGCHYGELLHFDGGGIGLALELHEDGVGAAILSGEVSTSGVVRKTGHIAEVCVGDELLGRVINPLGHPLDGKELRTTKSRPIESRAPTIMERAPVGTPLETGILAIDSMIPIGRGQRELIIGDRQTGKTSIALSAIMNQRDKGVYCVYCAIGQKASTVSGIVHTLTEGGAMANTVVVAAFGSDSAALQYIAPYAACAIAEEFMHSGKDVLIIYDDLSKHAVAYRAMSLLLRRPTGREAYPGDVFYLHSRLLERAARLSPELGGGSMTALPIVETMAGDISSYIPTNIISITDGQIYLESELFHAGMRPAVNVGLSVSRVGRAAQFKAMRDVSKSLRLEVAQYRDMAIFAQFGADIDSATARMLANGERLMELIKQPVEELLPLASQVAVLLAAQSGVFEDVDKHDVDEYEHKLLEYLSQNSPGILRSINVSGKLSENDIIDLKRQFNIFKQLSARESGVEHG